MCMFSDIRLSRILLIGNLLIDFFYNIFKHRNSVLKIQHNNFDYG